MPTLTLTLGIPGSGKSTWAQQQGLPILTTDGLRNKHGNRTTYLQQMELEANGILSRGLDLVIDACGTQAHQRQRWLAVAHQAGATTRLAIMACPLDLAIRRNQQRAHPVSQAAMAGYLRDWRTAIDTINTEGWDEIITA